MNEKGELDLTGACVDADKARALANQLDELSALVTALITEAMQRKDQPVPSFLMPENAHMISAAQVNGAEVRITVDLDILKTFMGFARFQRAERREVQVAR